ncbi:immunoglobulin-like domain-containing protein [Glycomyces artemisiae]|uniref:Glycosyl hydrolase family 43 n=1 Tax=Glycomyces artemisiae TaxID=1076443 RepID=A0A2T0UPW8_9ACTN|nr:immunoglobulin-like domain-containing protein [Glycomyces artemisiae]PRY59877.1 glycosyl hydrolase family 43 [Glycomyces artemisiae]
MHPRFASACATAALALGLAVTAAPASAADEALLLHYSFDAAPADGVTVADESGNGNDGLVRGTGAVFTGGVLSLPGGSASSSAAYVEIPTADLVGRQDLTISAWVADRSGAANVAAAFIGAPVASGASFSDGYWLLNPANPSGYVKSVVTNSVNASAPWSTEIGAGATGTPTAGVRTPAGAALYTTVIDGTDGTLTLYVNGVKTAEHAIARDVADFGANLVAYLGRSTYRDAYFAGDFDDLAVYGSALDADAAQALYSEGALDRAVASVSLQASATEDFALPTSSYGATIDWASDGDAIAVDGGTAVVTRPAPGSGDATVTLTATFTAAGQTRTRTYTVSVPEDLTDTEKADADLAAIAIPSADDVRTNVSVPTAGANGAVIEWTVPSGAPVALRDGAADGTRTLVVDRPAAGEDPVPVAVTATARIGDAVRTRDFTLTLQPLPAAGAEEEAYVWAFFTGEGAGAERVSLAASRGNDALSWNTLNDGEPLFTSTQGTQGLRDPFIIRSAEGDRFYMLATDLKVDGLAGGFDTAQRSGSLYIEVWESNDLVNWSEQRHVKVSSDYAGNTWAPEAYWDEELDTYVVYWASNLYDTTDPADRTAVTYNRMMYATTDDFTTFSEPQPWVDVKRGTGRGTIDATIAQVDDTYYRFIKDEASMTIRQERSDDLLDTVTGSLPGTTGAADEWTLVKDQVAAGLPNGEPGGTFTQGEGPSVFPANEGDVNGYDWYLFIDQPSYHAGPNYYIPFATDDIADGDAWEPVGSTLRDRLPENADGGKPRHGTVIPVTRAEYEAVLAAFAPGLAVTGAAPINVTTTAGTAPVLPGAHLTKADGSVQDVAVDWDAIDPAQYAQPGTFTVAGTAQDGSRAPVTAQVTVTAPLTLAASVRCAGGKAVVVVTATNTGDTTVDVVLSSGFGAKTLTGLAPGTAASAAFTTRQAAVTAGAVTATAGGAAIETAYPATTCG